MVTIDLDSKDWWLVRDAIAAALGGKPVTATRKKQRLVKIAEQVILRKLLGEG